jgi:hypothetical protein
MLWTFLFATCLFVLGCKTSPHQEGANQPQQHLIGEPPFADQTSRWGAAIAALHPMKVVHNGDDLVIVQKISNGVEYGKYLIPFESNRPFPVFGGYIFDDPLQISSIEGKKSNFSMYDYHRN